MSDEDQKDNLVAQSLRLEVEQVEFIELLAKRRVLGRNKSAVVRALLNNAIQDLVNRDSINKYMEAKEHLRKG